MLKQPSLRCVGCEVRIVPILPQHLGSMQQQREPETTLDVGVIKNILVD